MLLVTWNVQWCRGVDGRVDPGRIARVARGLCDFDILCLQEVAIGFTGLPGSGGEDQMAALGDALPGYERLFGPATDVDDGHGRRRQFGNAIFTRLPVIQVFRHLLPWPPDPAVPSMQRLALEAVVRSPVGPLRILTTHLEYYSARQRMAQVDALRALHARAWEQARVPRPDGDPGSPFESRPRGTSAILCGDCNFAPDSPDHVRLSAPFAGGVPLFVDAWAATHPGTPHPPSWGVHDLTCPRMCCDFVFVTEDLGPKLGRVEICAETDASDHQPVIVELGAP
jgi:endonuclease/exonuclease/phosphatase family metal-dependent hydrolase